MRCHICNTPLDEVKDDHGSVAPCETCTDVIRDTVEDFDNSDLVDVDVNQHEYPDTYAD